MTIEREFRLPFVFICLLALKAGIHTVTQIWQGPLWGGVLLGVLYALIFGRLSLTVWRMGRPQILPPKDPTHREFLNKFDQEMQSILKAKKRR